MTPDKSCAVILRERCGSLSVLAFQHPKAGKQLVKGSSDEGETPEAAVVRELQEEAGVTATVIANLGVWQSSYEHQVWAFFLCRPMTVLTDAWTHACNDDGGHEFRFFWQSLERIDAVDWHPVH